MEKCDDYYGVGGGYARSPETGKGRTGDSFTSSTDAPSDGGAAVAVALATSVAMSTVSTSVACDAASISVACTI